MTTNNAIKNQGGVFAEKPNRIVGLDMLRISLAILIYMFHSRMHFGCSYSCLNGFVSAGAIAMTGFFLLSGYSLRLVYGNKNLMEKHNLGKFYLKRILGTIPLYYFFAILFILFCGEESLLDNILLFPIEVLGLQSTFTSLFGVTHNGGTWFISCIILAYSIYPFIQFISKQLSSRYVLLLLILLVFIDIWGAVICRRFNTAWTYDNPFYRIVEFTCGVLVAQMNMEYDNKLLDFMRTWGALICSVLFLFIGVLFARYFLHFIDYMLYNIVVLPSFIAMLFSLGTLKMPMLEKTKIIGYLGKISYAFFLVQFFAWSVGKWAVELIGYDHNWLKILITFTYCVLASIIAYEFIQKPVVKFANKLLNNKLYMQV